MAMTATTTTNAHQAGVDLRRDHAGEPQDRERRDADRDEHERCRLGERREMLRLPVTVRVAAVGRPDRDADGEERQQRGDEVGARVHRLGDEPEAAAREAGRRA